MLLQPTMMLNRRHITVLFLLGFCSVSIAQLDVDRSLQFTGEQSEDRQLIGLAPSTVSNDVLSASVEQQGAFRVASPASGAIWDLELPSLSSDPAPGAHIVVTTPAVTNGPVTITVNGTGPYAVLLAPGQELQQEGLLAGTPLSMVFDGVAFQVMNGTSYARKPCAPGLVPVNGSFCIEPEQRAESDFFEAAIGCGNDGLRLCTWAEYIVACQADAALGIVGMTNNWEWTNDAANENGTARIVGSGGCLSTGNGLVTGSLTRGSRCCQTR